MRVSTREKSRAAYSREMMKSTWFWMFLPVMVISTASCLGNTQGIVVVHNYTVTTVLIVGKHPMHNI